MGFLWAASQTWPDWPSFRFFLRIGCLRSCLLAFHFFDRGKSWPDHPGEGYRLFWGRFCRLWSEVEMLIRMERFKEWTGLKSDLTNYRLNSSILVIRSAGVCPGHPSTSGTIHGVWLKLPEMLLLYFCIRIQPFKSKSIRRTDSIEKQVYGVPCTLLKEWLSIC
jgi:hypothetical protein